MRWRALDYLSEDRSIWWALVKMVMKCQGPYNAREYLTK
jgi:hypothetical protein